MKINKEKLQGHIETAKIYTFFAAVTNTIVHNPQLIERHMQKYLDEKHPQKMQEFVKWLYNNGESIYTYVLSENKIVLSEYSFSNTYNN